MLPRLLSAVPALFAVAAAASLPSYDRTFWSTWGDGRAELAGYDLTIPRYNQPRRGVAVTIFVTETFSNSARVKADPGKHPQADEYPVIKLNLVKDYQTGIYDYNEMTSSFVALQPVNGRAAGSPTRISFSRQEWCGQISARRRRRRYADALGPWHGRAVARDGGEPHRSDAAVAAVAEKHRRRLDNGHPVAAVQAAIHHRSGGNLCGRGHGGAPAR